MPVQISLTYDSQEDRLHLQMQTSDREGHWWLTRRIALRMIRAWLGKLEEVPPPTLDIPWMPKPEHRKLHEEHAISMEFDAPRQSSIRATVNSETQLIRAVQLSVTPISTRLTLVVAERKTAIALTRKESHSMVEALCLQARRAQWLQGMTLPDWMGRTKPEAPTIE